jgi:hypothetical protein
MGCSHSIGNLFCKKTSTALYQTGTMVFVDRFITEYNC